MFDDVVEPRRCARCGAEPSGRVTEHDGELEGFRLKLGHTTHFYCACGHEFFIDSPGRMVGVALAALANAAFAVILLQLLGGPRKVLEAGDLWPLILVALATAIAAYLVPRVFLSELHRRQNPRR